MTMVAVVSLTSGCSREAERAAEKEQITTHFAGSDVCAGCHPAEHAKWKGSVHARNMMLPTSATVLGDFDQNNVYTLGATRSVMRRETEQFLMDYTNLEGETETLSIDYALGSARHQVYLHKRSDGRLQVLPTYWNTEEGQWLDATLGAVARPEPLAKTEPGYWDNWARTWNRACIDCHSSEGRRNYDPETNTYASTFDPAINCEACHGPAGDHVRRWRDLKPGGSTRDGAELVAFKRLSTEESIYVCATCHASKRIMWDGYNLGENLFDFYVPEVWNSGEYFVDGRSSNLNYRFVEYMQSTCFRQSSEKMTCNRCHSAHDLDSARETTVVEANDLCTSCHVSHKTRLAAHTHHLPESAGSRCVECHMPTMDLGMRMTVRDHTIGSPLPELTAKYGVPNACANCHVTQEAGWADAHVKSWFGGTDHFQHYRSRTLERAAILDAAFSNKPIPVDKLASWLNDPDESVIQRASAAFLLQRDSQNIDALETLLRHTGNTSDLVRYYVVNSLGSFKSQRAAAALVDALADKRRSVRIEAYERLQAFAPSFRDESSPEVARARQEHAHSYEVSRRDDPRMRSEQALHAFGWGDYARAERLLRERQALTKNTPEGYADLAQFLIATQRVAEAENTITALEQIAPGSEAAILTRATLLLSTDKSAAALDILQDAIASGKDSRAIQNAYQEAKRRSGLNQ
jgi:Flp pilus assembly protein TadD